MLSDKSQYKGPFVLIGNGEAPNHTTQINILKSAMTILCTDGGADKLRSLDLQPDIILGDMDSLSLTPKNYNCRIVKLTDQSKTDLEKSLEWCYENGIRELSLVGFSGAQDDHNMAALWTLVSFFEKMELTFYSNSSKIKCLKSDTRIDSFTGQTISIIPTKENIEISVSGLEYSFKKSILKPPSFGTRNSAKGKSFSIQSNGPVWVFLNYAD